MIINSEQNLQLKITFDSGKKMDLWAEGEGWQVFGAAYLQLSTKVGLRVLEIAQRKDNLPLTGFDQTIETVLQQHPDLYEKLKHGTVTEVVNFCMELLTYIALNPGIYDLSSPKRS